MQALENMMASVPKRTRKEAKTLADCVEVCLDCEATCVTCAEACRREPQIDMLRQCIALNIDCADICGVTGRTLARAHEGNGALVRAMLDACARACAVCGAECRRHAGMHEHCRVCAEACERCERECRVVLRGMEGLQS